MPVTGSSVTFPKKAPHPNAAKLFIEWILSPQGLVIFETVSGGLGVATPSSGTRLAKALEGRALVYRTEETILKVIETGLEKKLASLLGVTPGGE